MLLPRLASLLDDAAADAVLLTFLPDVRWACGFTGSSGLLLVLPDGAHFVTDGRYDAQARAEVHRAAVHVPGYDLIGPLPGLVPDGARVALQPEHVTLAQRAELEERLPGRRFVSVPHLMPPRVAVKEAWEVDRIVRAQRITEAVFEEVCALLRPGLTERAVAAEIVHGHLRRGCSRMAFDPIVASGPNGALPHARPTDRVLEAGDLVVLDMGGVVDGYASDMTRTVALGEPGEEARRVYAVVREAQAAAIAAARAGMTGAELDGIARAVIAHHGYGDEFAHGLGHGIGLQTHEWPRVSFTNPAPLPAGACVTIEPGVYLDGRFGVRIEDIVHLRADGCTNLTHADTALRVL